MNREKLGKTIRAARQSRNLTQAQLAEKTGYARQTISRWEQADQAITVEALVKILKVLRIGAIMGDKEARVCIRIS